MMIGQDDHAKSQANVFCESAQSTKDDFWARRHRKTRQEVVFHEPDRIKSHLVGQDVLFERLFDHGMVVDDGPLHLIRQAESHAIPHSNRRKTCALHLQAWRIVAELWPERNVYLIGMIVQLPLALTCFLSARCRIPSVNVGRNSSRGRTRPCPPWARSAGSRS